MTWTSRSLAFASLGTLALAAAASGCLPPTNPCDPAAPEELQARIDLSGVVRDQQGEPASEVTVIVQETGQTATTNGDGAFTLSDLAPADEYNLTAYPESPAVGGTLNVSGLGCNESRDALDIPIVRPPDSPEVEITAATAPDRLLVAFPSALTGDDAVVAPMGIDDLASVSAWCGEELRAPNTQHRYWLEVRAPFGVWQTALLNVNPLVTKHAHDGYDLQGAHEYLGERCLRATCGFYAYQYGILEDQPNARCTEVVGLMNEDGQRQRLSPFETYQVRVRADQLVRNEAITSAGIPSAVTSTASASPERLSMTPTVLLPVPISADEDLDAQARADLDISSIVPVADGRFALIDGATMVVVGAGSEVAQAALGAEAELAADASENVATVEGGMFFDDVTSEMTQLEISSAGAAAVDLLPAGKWVRVWKRLQSGESMIDKVWVGDAWGSAPANDSPEQPVFGMDVTGAELGEKFLGFRWLAAPEGDPTDPLAPYSPPDAYMLVFDDGIAMLEAETAESDNAEPLIGTSEEDAPQGENPRYFQGEPDAAGNQPSMCDNMGAAMGNYTEGGAGVSAHGACFDINRALDGVNLKDAQVLRSVQESSLTSTTVHLFADAQNNAVHLVPTDHLLARNLPAGANSADDVIDHVFVGIEPVALQSSVFLECSGTVTDSKTPVMLVANRGSQDLSVLRTEDYGLEANPRYGVVEVAVIPLPVAPVAFFGDHGVPTCAGPYSWVVGEAGQMLPIDMRSLSLPECKEGPCSVQTRSRARAGAIARSATGDARVLIGGQGVLSEVGYLLPSPRSRFITE